MIFKAIKEYKKRKEERKKLREDFLSNFRLIQDSEHTQIEFDMQHEEFVNWLVMIHGFIQKCLENIPEIKNYLVWEMIIGKQKVEFSIVKDFRRGPHAIRVELEKENKALKEEICRLKAVNKE